MILQDPQGHDPDDPGSSGGVWAERQRRFDRPVLVVWATEDRLMPREHGRRLADLFTGGRLVEIADSHTLIPEDQLAELAAALRDFLKDTR